MKIYTGPLKGMVTVGELDRSPEARTKPDKDLRMMLFNNNQYFREVKHYQGEYCKALSWRECDYNGDLLENICDECGFDFKDFDLKSAEEHGCPGCHDGD